MLLISFYELPLASASGMKLKLDLLQLDSQSTCRCRSRMTAEGDSHRSVNLYSRNLKQNPKDPVAVWSGFGREHFHRAGNGLVFIVRIVIDGRTILIRHPEKYQEVGFLLSVCGP